MVGENLEALKRREMLRSIIDKKQISELINTKFETIDPETSLSDAVAKMKAADLYEIPVVEKKKLVGVLSFGSMIKKRAMVAGMKVKGLMDIPPGITAETTITEAAEQFIATNYRNMPVVKGTSLVGILSRADVIKIVQGIKEFKNIKASDIMTYDITAVESREPIRNALEMMRRIDVRTIPVVDGEFKLAGIIGIRDIINFSWTGGRTAKETRGEKVGKRDPVEVRVDSIMHPNVTTIEQKTTVNEAVKLMLKQNISTLPVVEKDIVKGVLTAYDILELMASVRERDVVYMQISGLEEEDRYSLDTMEREIQTELAKISKIQKPMLFNMHVQKYNVTGNGAKYSLTGRLHTAQKAYIASAVEWSLMGATAGLMKRFDEMVMENKEEKIEKRKRMQ
ncbi:MAG: CBS domain-containing protein [Methanomassiliicoccales archaeon]|jgi:CBS domain-containing protein